MQRDEPLLLTPGPLTTSAETKRAMLRDWGSRDAEFIKLNRDVRDRLVEIIHGEGAFTCVPVQGSGTFAVEAMLGTFVPRDGKILILVNGAYGHRMAKISEYMGRACQVYETAEDVPPDPDRVGQLLRDDMDVTHVVAVHCETTSGILNPLSDISKIVQKAGRRFLVDAMSSFGAIDAADIHFDAMAASSNKCLQGVPGMGFVLCRRSALENCKGNAHSLSLDLHDQWTAMEGNGQWRFTPPTHVVAAFHAALAEFDSEGGVAGRHRRYSENCRILVTGMREMGFEPLLSDNLQAPVIVTFHMPKDPNFVFQQFYDALQQKGFVIYPGKLTAVESFRIGCIGDLTPQDMRNAVAAIRDTLSELGVASGAPA